MNRSGSNIVWHEGSSSRSERERLLGQRGVTLWMTGLSGSGKSTIAALVEQQLVAGGHLAYRLDGDNIRFGLNAGLGFSPEDRTENIRRISEVAKLFTDAGLIVLVSFISPCQRDRDDARSRFAPGDFVEIYVKASLELAESRDPKGLYKKARAGEIRQFTGIDAPYEAPANAEIVLDTQLLSQQESARTVCDYLDSHGYLRRK